MANENINTMNNSAFHPDLVLFTFILAINVGIISFVVYCRMKKKKMNRNWLEPVRQLGQFALAVGVFMQLIELFSALGALEGMNETLPFNKIAAGLKVTLYPTLHGLEVYLFSLISYIVLRLTERPGLV